MRACVTALETSYTKTATPLNPLRLSISRGRGRKCVTRRAMVSHMVSVIVRPSGRATGRVQV